MHDHESALLVFGMRNQLLEHELDRVEREFAIDLGRGFQREIDADDSYYPQIESSIRREAALMAPHYEVFYSLEKTIRALVADSLEAEEGEPWWTSGRIPDKIKADARALRHQANPRLGQEAEAGRCKLVRERPIDT